MSTRVAAEHISGVLSKKRAEFESLTAEKKRLPDFDSMESDAGPVVGSSDLSVVSRVAAIKAKLGQRNKPAEQSAPKKAAPTVQDLMDLGREVMRETKATDSGAGDAGDKEEEPRERYSVLPLSSSQPYVNPRGPQAEEGFAREIHELEKAVLDLTCEIMWLKKEDHPTLANDIEELKQTCIRLRECWSGGDTR